MDKLAIYTEQFAPYNYYQDEQFKGINLELTQMACHRAGLQCQFVLLPWRRAMKMASTKTNSGLVSTSRTLDREEMFQWVGPLVSGASCFYKLTKRDDIVVTDRASLLNYTVALEMDDVYKELLDSWGFEENTHYIVFPVKQGDIAPFANGKLDLIIGSAITIGAYLKGTDITINDIEPVFRIHDQRLRGNHLALNLKVPSATVKRLQTAVDELKAEQKHVQLVQKYVYADNPGAPASHQHMTSLCL